MSLPDDNPKTKFGIAKPAIHAIPSTALFLLGQAMQDGERKYGLLNWREKGVTASIYFDALARHTWQWWEGEWADQHSGLPHLAHAMANCAILLDASMIRQLKDDRPRYLAPLTKLFQQLENKETSK